MARYFPSPAKFWVVTFILLITGLFYLGFQEYNDIKALTNSINTVYSVADRIERHQKEVKTALDQTHDKVVEVDATINPPSPPVDTPESPATPQQAAPLAEHRIVVQHYHFHHHYYHQPPNPIVDAFQHLFRGH